MSIPRLFLPAPATAWSPGAAVGIADTVAATAVFKKSLRFVIAFPVEFRSHMRTLAHVARVVDQYR